MNPDKIMREITDGLTEDGEKDIPEQGSEYMALNRNLLLAYNNREIHISEFLEKLKPLENLNGGEKRVLQDKIAKEIEETYPYRKGRGPNPEI